MCASSSAERLLGALAFLLADRTRILVAERRTGILLLNHCARPTGLGPHRDTSWLVEADIAQCIWLYGDAAGGKGRS
jgi:hypothetical protein